LAIEETNLDLSAFSVAKPFLHLIQIQASVLEVATNFSLRGHAAPDVSVPDVSAPDMSSAHATAQDWLLRQCDDATKGCQTDNMQILACILALSTTLIIVLCVFAFLREDKEENITPLCPQLIVKDQDLHFRMPSFNSLDTSSNDFIDILDADSEILCRVVLDWPDASRPGHTGVAATVRIQNQQNLTLATVVARNVAVAGQGLALCRAGCEIFGFVEPDGENLYSVRHRTGVELLTFTGDFLNWDVEVCNPVGLKVCHFRELGAISAGHILQHVDAGLVICGLMAAHVHTQLVARETKMQ